MKTFLTLLFVFGMLLASAQKRNAQLQLHIRKTSEPIVIDGEMNEITWQLADSATNFFMVLPMDTSHARVPTEVRMSFDDENIYIIAVCHLLKEGPYMVESLRRDFNFGKNDNFIFFLDPFNDLTNGYTFGANAAGAQWDGTLYEGGKADLNWDNKWRSVVKSSPGKWVFEAAIPWTTIRYKKDLSTWGVNFSRLDITAVEKSAWAPVPRQFPTASLAYTGQLIWDDPLPQTGLNLSIIPYALTAVSKNYESRNKPILRKDVGVDAKVGITSSLNLDLTVNPDYSQVEVDQQVTNLERFELFFPERRQFFLENNDLFSNFGLTNIRPFFSRRIGLGTPISFGARLSGSLDKNWRIGLMDMQTRQVEENGLPAQNFAVLALQRRVFARSNFRLFFVNKESLDYVPGQDSSKPLYSLFNRNIGAEYNLASNNNRWLGKLMMVKSFSPGPNERSITANSFLQYSSRRWLLSFQQEYVGRGYNAEVGYVPRRNYVKLNPLAGYLFFPARTKILSHGPRITSNYYFDPSMHKTDYENIFMYLFNMRDQSTFDLWASRSYVQLLQPFDPTNTGKDSLLTGTIHDWNAAGFDYVSKPQKLFTYSLSGRLGGYFAGGQRQTLTLALGYRFQPYVGITVNCNYNHIELPQPWGNTTFWLIGPRIDITMTNTLFFTTFFQYNNQLKNVNLNTRLQWRYRPASDLFLVYTDNYYPVPFAVRNRAFVLKLTYWWNN